MECLLYLCMEKFLDVKGYEGLYVVSNYGNVKSVERVIIRRDGIRRTIKGRIKMGTHDKGYKRISLVSMDGKSKSHYVHRLVMSAFCEPSGLYVDHINGIKEDNRLENLRYVTNSENLTFRNTDKKYSTEHPYIYKTKENCLRVHGCKRRYKTIEQALERAREIRPNNGGK